MFQRKPAGWQARYSLQVLQYSLSDESYDYWKRIEEQNQESGGIYERQPEYISGNLYNINHQEEYVLGFFNLCPVSEKRIFLDSIPELIYPPIDCTLEIIQHPAAKPIGLRIPSSWFHLILWEPGLLTEWEDTCALTAETGAGPSSNLNSGNDMKRILAHTILLVSVMQIQTFEAGAQASQRFTDSRCFAVQGKTNPVHRPEPLCFR
jgi:hypothetical protein